LLDSVCGTQRDVPAQQDLIRGGDEPGPVFVIVIVKGWACRYKLLPEGTRQVTSFLTPGDCGDLHASVAHRMEHSVATLTPARVAKVDRKEMEELEELIETRPAIMRAFLWTLLVDEDTLRAWSGGDVAATGTLFLRLNCGIRPQCEERSRSEHRRSRGGAVIEPTRNSRKQGGQ
jgi:CRP-like cAMP-binding protein